MVRSQKTSRKKQAAQGETGASPPPGPGAQAAPREDPFAKLPLAGFCFCALILVLLFSRFLYLDNQAFHHDESIHAFYSWKFLDGGAQTYKYDPVYHGPFLYHIGALFFRFLPDSDFTARTPYAVIGVLWAALFFVWGRRFGAGTCLLIVGMLTLSPVVNYFSRFARNDVYQCAWLAGMIVFGALYFRTSKLRYLTATSLFLVLSYCTKENSYVNNFIVCSFVVLWGAWRLIRRPRHAIREIFVERLALVRLLILFGGFSFFVFFYVAVDSSISPETGLGAGLKNIATHSVSLTEKMESGAFEGESGYFSGPGREDVRRQYFRAAFGITFFAMLLVELLSFGLEGGRSAIRLGALGVGVVLFYLLIGWRLSALIEWVNGPSQEGFIRHLWQRVLGDAALICIASLALVALDRFPKAAARAGGDVDEPEEPSATGSRVWDAVVRWKPRLLGYWSLAAQLALAQGIYLTLFTSLGTNVQAGAAGGMYKYISYWFRHQTGEYRIWGPWWYYLPRLMLFETLPLMIIALFGVRFAVEKIKAYSGIKQPSAEPPPPSRYWKPIPKPLLAFSAYMSVFMFCVYAGLNEKVPWLATYQSFSLILLAALMAGHWLATHPNSPGPVLGRLMDFKDAALNTGAIASRGMGVWIGRTLRILFLACGFFFVLGQHITTVFARPDYPNELLVYTGTTNNFVAHIRKIKQMQDEREALGKEPLSIAVEGQAEWPCAWYFRNDEVRWKGVDLKRDIQILDDSGDNRRRMQARRGKVWDMRVVDIRGWWITDQSPQVLPGGMKFWPNVWAFFTNAENDNWESIPEEQRPPREEYAKNFRSQVLDYVFKRISWSATAGQKTLICYKTLEDVDIVLSDAYLEGADGAVQSVSAQESFGSAGAGAGQFNQPRGLAFTPEGNLVVADSKNGRIQVFLPEGVQLFEFGAGTLNVDVTGPCDVACDAAGNFYVADTWNQTIRKFNPLGELVKSQSESIHNGEKAGFYGPRGIAVNSKGAVYVADTGNKFIRVFDADLNPVFSWGAGGEGEGFFDEPVGIAIDSQDRVFVADTGNGRIQRFSESGAFEEEYFTVMPEDNERISVEPYLTILPDGRIVETFSSRGQFWLIDPDAHTTSILSLANPQFETPHGIVADAQGRLWIGGRNSARIAIYQPPPKQTP